MSQPFPREQAGGHLTTAQLGELLRALPAADAVELKVAVPDSHRRAVLVALGVDPLDAAIRQVLFVDTPQMALLNAGVVLRARRSHAHKSDVVVKLRPLPDPSAISRLRGTPGFKVEIDVSPRAFASSCSLRSKVADRRLRDLLSGRRAIDDVLTAAQLDLLEAHRPPSVSLQDLVVFGPVHVLKRKFSPESFPGELVAEQWFLPDGERVLELSTRCEVRDVFQMAAETRTYLDRHGVDLSAPQQPKTHTALAALVADHQRSTGT